MSYAVSGEHPLQTGWCFWFDHREKSSKHAAVRVDYRAGLKKVGSFATVESFWRHYVYLKRPSELDKAQNLHMFREGHMPMWEVRVGGARRRPAACCNSGAAPRITRGVAAGFSRCRERQSLAGSCGRMW